LSQYRAYDSRGQLTAVKDTQGHETRYEYNAAGDLTTVIAPDGRIKKNREMTLPVRLIANPLSRACMTYL
ncbi:RHS repeat protein, partial [Escherichia coli]